jgi:hypothetical protein
MLQHNKYAEPSYMLRECGRVDTLQNVNGSNRRLGHTYYIFCFLHCTLTRHNQFISDGVFTSGIPFCRNSCLLFTSDVTVNIDTKMFLRMSSCVRMLSCVRTHVHTSILLIFLTGLVT